jgi:hypothetical protein
MVIANTLADAGNGDPEISVNAGVLCFPLLPHFEIKALNRAKARLKESL